MSRIAVIGGTGFAALGGLAGVEETMPETPYGPPSAPVSRGFIAGGGELLFLPRHGPGHRIPPHRIDYRANLWALKACGAEDVVALAAVGGIGAAYQPSVLVVPDQIIDYTYGRAQTFYEGGTGSVTHIDFTRPYCDSLRAGLLHAAVAAGVMLIDHGTHGITQGPRLETAAEVRRLERDGCDIVGMTGMPEAALARELALCYACLAFVVNRAAGTGGGAILISEIEANIAACSERVQRILAMLTVGR
jgi:5'-methylthioadenosine phosphorylase/5'-methylthioinosine phosphorylase